MANNLLHFEPCFSLEPNKLVLFNKVFYNAPDIPNSSNLLVSTHYIRKGLSRLYTNKRVSRSHHNWQLSANAYRTLKRRINWLYYLAKSRHVKTYSGKDIWNFKMAFMTLTLSGTQNEPTANLHKKLINPFLTELRQRTGMKNYVFKLEFQNNGNAHWHFVTDTYLDYFFVLKIWNRLQKKHGYITEYQNKMSAMTLTDYVQFRNRKHEVSYSDCVKAFARGKRDNWEQPNSVDVKSVSSGASISYYVSKYFGKGSEIKCACNENDTPDNSKALRLWFSSRSLSKMNSVSDYMGAVNFDVKAIVSHAKEVRKVFIDYAQMYFFDISSMSGRARKWLEKILKDYSKRQGYIPAC